MVDDDIMSKFPQSGRTYIVETQKSALGLADRYYLDKDRDANFLIFSETVEDILKDEYLTYEMLNQAKFVTIDNALSLSRISAEYKKTQTKNLAIVFDGIDRLVTDYGFEPAYNLFKQLTKHIQDNKNHGAIAIVSLNPNTLDSKEYALFCERNKVIN